MRKFHSIAALCGDELRPELQTLFDRLAINRDPSLFVSDDGMVQSGPEPASETAFTKIVPRMKNMPELASGSADVRLGVICVALTARSSLPVFPYEQTSAAPVAICLKGANGRHRRLGLI
jgi:hypothetical protein